MLKPSVNELTKNGASSYELVIATAKRAREIANEAEENKIMLDEKPVTLAIREIHNGEVKIVDDGKFKN